MLRPLVDDDFPAAAALLTEGFPERSRAFWEAGLRRLRRYAGNAACGIPLGQLMLHKGEAVGIALTPASQRRRPGGRRYPLVNFSSWYVRSEYRWRAPLMLRAVVSDPDATYIDLTPTPQVQKLLLASGFRAVNTGTDIALLPLCALGAARAARVRELAPDDVVPETGPPLPMLLEHRELGCLPLVLEHDEGQTLFLAHSRSLRGMPAARLKYVGSHAVLQRHLPALARHLLARGHVFLTWDARAATAARFGTVHRPGGIWYAKGEIVPDCTDFVGTELCILGV